MPDLLLELFSEEIPARMQARAEADLARMMVDSLRQGGLDVGATHSSSGPRRIVFIAERVPPQSAATVEERKGPRVGAPPKAVEGFLRAAGLKGLDECQVVKDPKGDFYLAKSEKPGRPAASIIAEAVPEIVRKFPWPKSMRWAGVASAGSDLCIRFSACSTISPSSSRSMASRAATSPMAIVS